MPQISADKGSGGRKAQLLAFWQQFVNKIAAQIKRINKPQKQQRSAWHVQYGTVRRIR